MVDRLKTVARWLFRVFRLVFLVALGGGVIVAICGWLWYRDVMREVPDTPNITSLYPSFASNVTTVDGHRIAGVNRTVKTPLAEIPPILIAAFLAAEDAEFYFHQAYSPRGIARAVIENYRGKKIAQGASTITQQVARQFLTRAKTYRRKTTEILLAQRIERFYSKNEILHVYLESVFLGHRAEGVTQAAWRYFNKDLGDLTLAECALLAGIAPAPSKYNPRASIDNATRERGRVLRRMFELGMISGEERDEALAEAVNVRDETIEDPSLRSAAIRAVTELSDEEAWATGGFTVVTPQNPDANFTLSEAIHHGVAALEKRQGFRGVVGTANRPEEFANYLEKIGETRLGVVAEVDGSKLSLVDGRVLNLDKNRWAEPSATPRHFKRPAKLKSFRKIAKSGDVVWLEDESLAPTLGFEAAGMFVESKTGRPVGSIGAVDPDYDAFHRVWQGCRQPGSVFKPVVYAEAFSRSLSPATMVSDVPVQLDTNRGGVWRPRNADRDFKGYITIARALASSRNIPVARLMDHLGASSVISRARKLGITSPINASSAASLGANCTKPWEVARMYLPFQRRGWATAVVEFDRVVRDGAQITTGGRFSWPSWSTALVAQRMTEPEKRTRAISEQVAYVMMEQLHYVTRRGTAHELPKAWEIAGKTGTTNKYDAWFVGFDGDLTTVVWVGSDKNTRPLGRGEHGATVALPIFERAYGPFARFEPLMDEPPVGVEKFRIDPDTGLLAPPGEFGLEYSFVGGTEPTELAPNLGAKQSQRIDELIYDF